MNQKKRIIAITGGIGSGKSVVQAILKALGHEVYDCDLRAKILMDTDANIRKAIYEGICPDAVKDSYIDRSVLARHVFECDEALKKLNALVHSEVIKDFRRWSDGKRIAFVETAILFTSGMDREVSEIWEVMAPEQIRIKRVETRNPDLDKSQIIRRMESQKTETEALKSASTNVIINDGVTPLLPQIERLLYGVNP